MNKSVLEWIDETANKYGDKTAYSESNGSTLTFGQLRMDAMAIGTALTNVTDRIPIAVLCGRHVTTIEAFLGVVYSGHAYAPIDGKLPANRILSILNVLKPTTMVADEENYDMAQQLLQEFPGIVLYKLEEIVSNPIDYDAINNARHNMVMTDPLYVIFTSGSTGKPKGVITSHQSLMCYIESYSNVMGITPSDILGNQSPLDYIAAIRDIYIPLYLGCSTVIIPKEYFMQPDVLFDFMNENKITSVGWSVSAFTILTSLGAFADSKLSYLKKICFSGAVMPSKCLMLWQKNLPNAKFVNQYGPTEATASCTYYEIDHMVDADEILPIGKAYNHYRVFLLNEDLTPTDRGSIGEICVSGPVLALGYYNDADRTNISFIMNPNCKGYPERIYKTGDYGREREDGILEFHGRKDRQIKHLGHRVELDEVECAANRIDGVKESVCLYNSDKEVINLFYSGDVSIRDLSISLRTILPEFMVPRKIKQFDSLPKLSNGKIDMNSLKESMK